MNVGVRFKLICKLFPHIHVVDKAADLLNPSLENMHIKHMLQTQGVSAIVNISPSFLDFRPDNASLFQGERNTNNRFFFCPKEQRTKWNNFKIPATNYSFQYNLSNPRDSLGVLFQRSKRGIAEIKLNTVISTNWTPSSYMKAVFSLTNFGMTDVREMTLEDACRATYKQNISTDVTIMWASFSHDDSIQKIIRQQNLPLRTDLLLQQPHPFHIFFFKLPKYFL